MPQTEHISKQFDADLEAVRTRVLHMGGVVEEQIIKAIDGLASGNLAAIEPREELRRNMTHLIWLFAYANAIYWGASYFTEQDGTWHQTIVRDTDFTPSHIIEFYLSYPIYIITGFGAFLYAKTRLPFFAEGLSLPYLVTVVGPFMILPNVGLNEWGHTFWFMEELFVAPLHYGFVFFGWLALAIAGVLLQVFASFGNLIGNDICEAVDQGLVAK